jgi:hypothetical protein
MLDVLVDEGHGYGRGSIRFSVTEPRRAERIYEGVPLRVVMLKSKEFNAHAPRIH